MPARRSTPASRPGGARRRRCAGFVELDVALWDRRRCRDRIDSRARALGRGRRAPSTPAARTPFETGRSRRSLPETAWPISASTRRSRSCRARRRRRRGAGAGLDRSSGATGAAKAPGKCPARSIRNQRSTFPTTTPCSARRFSRRSPRGCETAVFALGCFWGAERLFWEPEASTPRRSATAGGFTPNPTYEEVCTGQTGHAEVVLVVFDPAKVSYEQLLKIFFE